VCIERRRWGMGWVYGDFVKTKEKDIIKAEMMNKKKRCGKNSVLSILPFSSPRSWRLDGGLLSSRGK
jgi:hypothetical protein